MKLLYVQRDYPAPDDYVLARLLDDGPLFDPIGRLRAVYPNVLTLERAAYERTGSTAADRPRPGTVGEVQLFEHFFEFVTGDPLGDERRAAVEQVVDGLERRRREAD